MNILKKPLLTEKANSFSAKGVYGFLVDYRANKVEIKKSIEANYSVVVVDVNTMRLIGKKSTKYTKTRMERGKRPNYKKALVKLKEGEVIDFYGDVS